MPSAKPSSVRRQSGLLQRLPPTAANVIPRCVHSRKRSKGWCNRPTSVISTTISGAVIGVHVPLANRGLEDMLWRRSAVVLFALFVLIASSEPLEERCAENELFDKCAGTCEATCKGRTPCVRQMCRGGCRCKDGFARDDDASCVRLKECVKDAPIFDY
ncbi:hypothetical protein QR680_006328 [Steinernema hermaphroditum]|uniref:TIL domain-containing protein n=1 Tax=Steinernema hermaphroditum TaxID=289476 RepID=A0AA39HV62_9BILA|nr:hypothetical protein QR680_006328 [Steinernema hermaphroditum]